mgnify:CR=1 FL=1
MGEINFFPENLEIRDQKVILRLDLNVPIKNKIITDDTRITLCLPFINKLIEKKAKIIIISHLGRPKGINIPELSLMPVYKFLKDMLKTNVYFFRGTFDNETNEKFSYLKEGEVILIENIRFFKSDKYEYKYVSYTLIVVKYRTILLLATTSSSTYIGLLTGS